jgi:membrane-associated protein
MGYLSGVILQAADAWWIFPALFVFCLIDGFLPVLPNATLIVALAALSETSGSPNLWLLGAAGAAGAVTGDNIAYRISARIGATRYAWRRKPGIDRALHRARFELDKRGAVLIFTARYLPGGRTAVNFTAGATAYPLTMFIWLDSAAALTWAGYCIGVGVIAGKWVQHQPLPAAAAAIVLSLVIGVITDHLLQRLHRHRRARITRPETGDPTHTPEPG